MSTTIYLTTHLNPSALKPDRISSTIVYGASSHTLVKIPDNVELYQEKDNPIFFPLITINVDGKDWDYDAVYPGGLIEGCELVFGLSYIHNIAGCIAVICKNSGDDPFELWEQQIKKS